MRVLLVGAGGVGTAITRIAARRDFFDRFVVADYDLARAGGARGGAAARGAGGARARPPPPPHAVGEDPGVVEGEPRGRLVGG
ncbi:hypothetical protein ACFV1T_15555, partial [Streptomyces vinaceus]